jgi:hypothetical protein
MVTSPVSSGSSQTPGSASSQNSSPTSPQKLVKIKDLKIFLALMSCGHSPKRVESDEKVLYFLFDQDDIEADLSRYLSGEPFMVDIHAVWRSQDIFKSYLNNRKVT